MTNQEQMKRNAAQAAIELIEYDDIVGVGTGSTVNYFIDELAKIKGKIDGVVASSKATEMRLKSHGLRVLNLNQTGTLPIYVDGADEANSSLQLIKGGGGALTGEKIIAQASETFVCIVDESKVVDVLGQYPIATEVLPMAQSLVARQLVSLGGMPDLREDYVTDHGNVILDLKNIKVINPPELEKKINDIPGVVTNGIFAIRGADKLLIAREDGSIGIETNG